MSPVDYCFDANDMQRASEEWGCNCGPSALAFVVRMKPDDVHSHIPEFDTKRYTSPTMMRAALKSLGYRVIDFMAPHAEMFGHGIRLVRVQWTGPWTAQNSNPRWAYQYTHWIASWLDISLRTSMVFDCNGGIRSFQSWIDEIRPALTECYQRSDGDWFPTHVWLPEKIRRG